MIPTGELTHLLDASAFVLNGIDGIEYGMADDSDIGRRIIPANAALILAETHIKHPMQAVLYRLVRPDRAEQMLNAG